MEVRVEKIQDRSGLTVNQTNYGIFIGDWKFAALVERLKYDREFGSTFSITLWGGGLNFISNIEVFHQLPWIYEYEVWDYIQEYSQDVVTHLFAAN